MARPGGKEVGRVAIRVVPDSTRFNADLKKTLDRIENSTVVRIPLAIETRQADVDIRRFQKKWNGSAIAVDIDAKTALASAHLVQFTKKPRKVPLYVEVTQASLLKAGTLIAALSGGRLVGDMVKDVGTKLQNLDRSLPKITGVALGIASLSSVLFASVGGAGALAVALTQLLGVAGLIPAAFGAAGFSIITLVTAFSGVGAALKQMTTGSGAAARAGASLAVSERQIAQAQQAAKDAQLAVNAARKRAVLDLRDLSNSVVDASLAQRQGVIDLQAAQDAYNQTLADPTASAAARAQAQLDLDQATQSAKEQSQHLSDLQKQKKSADKAGVNGAANVIAAQRSLTQAQQQVLDLQTKSAAAAVATVNAFAKLSPAAQQAVGALLKVRTMLTGIRTVVQQNFFSGFASSLLNAANVIVPQLRAGMGALAAQLGSFSQTLLTSLKSSLGGGVLQGMLKTTAVALAALTPAISPLIAAVTTLGVVGVTFLPQMSDAISDAATSFNLFIQQAANSGALQQFITTGISAFVSLGAILGNLGSIIGGLFSGLAGGNVLSGFATVLGQIATVINSPGFQTTLATLFSGAVAGAAGLAAALIPIGAMLSTLAPVLSQVLSSSGVVVGQILGSIAAALAQPAFATGLSSFFAGIQAGLLAIAPSLPAVAAALGALGTFAGKLAGTIGPILGAALEQLAPILGGVLDALTPLLPILGATLITAVQQLGPALLDIVLALAPSLPGIIDAVVSLVPQLVILVQILAGVLQVVSPFITLISQVVGWLSKAWAGIFAFGTALLAGGSNLELISGIISGKFGPVMQWIGGLSSSIGKAFRTVFGDGPGSISSLVQSAFRGVVTFIASAINGIIDLVNGALGGINDVATKIRTITGGVVNVRIDKLPHLPIPSFEHGGNVPARTGGTIVRVSEAGFDESVVRSSGLNELIARVNANAARASGPGVSVQQNITTNDPMLAAQQAAQLLLQALKVRPT